jgi:hypothetical protein
VKVRVAKDGASTLKATIDGGVAFDGTLAAGQSQTYQVSDTAILKIGKPSEVTVTRDGKKIGLSKKSPATLTLKASEP